MAIRIKQAETEEELQRLYQFRYDVYVDEMARTQMYADHERRMIVEPLDESAMNIIALDDDTVVGGLRVNFSKYTDLGYYSDLYEMEKLGKFHPKFTSITTKLMIIKEHRKGRLAIRLAQAAYVAAVDAGIMFDFIDCNDHLLHFFKKLGYRQIRQKINHKEFGEVTPMIICVNDLEYFEQIESPLRTLSQGTAIGDESVAYFHKLLSETNLVPSLS